MNSANITHPYGYFKPKPSIQRLIRFSQHCPENWLGQQLAQVIRRHVGNLCSTLVDIEVCGIRFRSGLNDNASERKFVFMPWRFDRYERTYIERNLPKDGVFIDIGANVGIYSLWAATLLGSNGTIVSFEPNPPAFERLSFNMDANKKIRGSHWPKIKLLNTGVADRNGQFDLHLCPENLGESSLVLHATSCSRVNIPCVKLLDKLTQLNISKIDILKIDIEGAEEKALLPFLENSPKGLLPKCIIIENSDDHWKSNLRKAIAKHGYSINHKTKMNTVYPLRTSSFETRVA
ncbi:MAG: FkbM family methyltransferase [Pirellulales bacterium]